MRQHITSSLSYHSSFSLMLHASSLAPLGSVATLTNYSIICTFFYTLFIHYFDSCWSSSSRKKKGCVKHITWILLCTYFQTKKGFQPSFFLFTSLRKNLFTCTSPVLPSQQSPNLLKTWISSSCNNRYCPCQHHDIHVDNSGGKQWLR